MKALRALGRAVATGARALGRVIATEPTLIASAIRQTLLVVLGIGFHVDETTIVAVGLVVEGWLAVVQRALVTPETVARDRELDAEIRTEREVVSYLRGVEHRRRATGGRKR